jgi:hypothetical protein
MRPLFFALPLSLLLAALTGCTTSSAIMPASGGAYTITKSGTTGFTPLGVIRKEAYKEATAFAATKGMVAEVVSVNDTPAGFGRWPQVDLRFRLVAADSRAAGTPTLTVTSQSSHDAMGNPTETHTTMTATKEPEDFHAELLKLGELKEKGLLTEEEFQREKKRLLQARGPN